ncbi:hypothetical protein OE88DRAFT_1205027 [Heliocybe sulcata]|uniref:BTB domain-containing protein n=1 Tax=Heliocybe sulcata TaxID=5364 RepID=A0A5C3NA13_9AGAM|nr:hypothetical protein OE88DRAFT_1205027 [Heliocybe sulcata]
MEAVEISESEFHCHRHTATFKIQYRLCPSECERQSHVLRPAGVGISPTFSQLLGCGWRFGFSKVPGKPLNLSVLFDASGAFSPDSGLCTVDVEVSGHDGRLLVKDKGIDVQSLESPVQVCTYEPEGFFGITLSGSVTVSFKCTVRYRKRPRKHSNLGTILDTLATSIPSGTAFADIRIFAYSQRGSEGGACKPLPLFANSTILKATSSYLKTLLSTNDFAESPLTRLSDDFLSSEDDADYDYSSDSDLSESPDLADFAGTDDSDCQPAGLGDRGSGMSDVEEVTRALQTCAHLGRTIVMKDVAYRTLKALIMYLYTGDIVFSPLKSSKRGGTSGSSAISCSPKSMYRLADKLGLDDLKALAFGAIKTGLSEENIMEEVFSKFTSLYSQVEELETEFLHGNCRSPAVIAGVDGIVTKMVEEDGPKLDYSKRVLTAFIKQLAQK